MAINVSAVSEYIDQNKDQILRSSVIESKTASLPGVNIQTGVKSKAKLNYISTDVLFQDGKTCGWVASGNTTLSQREVEVGHLKLQEAYCDKDLTGKFLEYDVKYKAGEAKLPAESQFIDVKIEAIKSIKDKLLWTSTSAATDANYTYFEGFISVIDDSGLAVSGNTSSASGITVSNIIDLTLDMVSAAPSEIRGKDLTLFMGEENFNLLLVALYKANMYHVMADSAALANKIMVHPLFANVKIVATNGLNDLNRMFLMQTSNMVIATDLEGADEEVKFWYSEDNQEFRLLILFALGTQVYFPNYIVEFTLA